MAVAAELRGRAGREGAEDVDGEYQALGGPLQEELEGTEDVYGDRHGQRGSAVRCRLSAVRCRLELEGTENVDGQHPALGGPLHEELERA